MIKNMNILSVSIPTLLRGCCAVLEKRLHVMAALQGILK